MAIKVDTTRIENIDKALRQLRRLSEKDGIYSQTRNKECYKKPTEVRRQKRQEAVKRQLKKNRKEKQSRELAKRARR